MRLETLYVDKSLNLNTTKLSQEGQSGQKLTKWGQARPNRAVQGQAKSSKAKRVHARPYGARQGQTASNKAKG